MLKFFRRIRQRLMAENKLGKYLLYAVGEIVLVVIGILIALEVNNRNTQSVMDERRDQYYQSMIASFEVDLQEIDDYLRFIDNNTAIIDSYLNTVKNANSFKEAVASTKDIQVFTKDVDLNKSIWTTMVNSGDVNLLHEDIRQELLALWNSFDDYYEGDYANKEHYWDIIENAVFQTPGVTLSLQDLVKDNEKLTRELAPHKNEIKTVDITVFAFQWLIIGNNGGKRRMNINKEDIKSISDKIKSKLNN